MNLSIIQNKETLAEKAARFRNALKNKELGFNQIADEVVALSNDWNPEEADGLSASAWVRSCCGAGKGIGYFKRIASAFEYIGKTHRTWITHEVAVWLADQIRRNESQKSDLMLALRRHYESVNLKVPLTLDQVRPIAAKHLGKFSRPKHCARCLELQKQIDELMAGR
jgi:hypothetical protein